jgi:hypothetical protein
MKTIFYFTFIIGTLAACQQQEAPVRKATSLIATRGRTIVLPDFAVGDTARHVFELHNANDKPLRLVKCGSSCGCTTPACEPRILQPGEKFNLPVQVVMENEGPFDRSVVVETNADTPFLVLHLIGKALKNKG